MDSLDMVKGGEFSLRSYVASICKDDPRKCWAFQELIDYHEFRCLEGSTPRPTEVQSNPKGKEVVSENPAVTLYGFLTAPNAQNKRGRKGNGSGSENPAAPNVETCGAGGNANDIDVEEDSDYHLTVGEFASKVKALNIKKNKKKRKALEVEGPRLFVGEPRPTVSFGDLELLSSVAVSMMLEPAAEFGGANVQAPEEPRPDVSSGGLQPLGLRSRMHAPGVGTNGARVQAPVTGPEGPREHEVMVCRVSRNPAEFSTEIAKLFLRSL
ncbi:uncharacterized protein LOC143543165 [Bidens hawaiensis]|uniref:uncharacterized protein LOC143543165 n=1 Tax=Bidens hawaiensis TaxID=980011 RepID=UPI004049AB0E